MALFKKKADRSRAKLEKILKGSEVPTMPKVALQILHKIRDHDSSMQEIAETLQWDPGLVTRIFKTVNSTAYGTARPIDDVRHAATYLGRTQLEQIVLALSVRSAVPQKPAPGFEVRRYWRTAAFRAALARQIAGRLHPARQVESFTIGLLQDMAVPVLATARPDDYGKVLNAWHGDRELQLAQLERDAFGWTHAEVGALLGRSFELPDAMVELIELHHKIDATDAELPPALRLVALLRETEIEHGLDALVEEARSDYGLEPEWTQETVKECREQAEELASILT